MSMAIDKSFPFLIILFISSIQSSCVKKDELLEDNKLQEYRFDQKSLELHVGNTIQITSKGKISAWKSSKKFVGTIEDDGTFTAHHIGKTKISAKIDDKNHSLEIKVIPNITDIPEPVSFYGKTKNQITSLEKRKVIIDKNDVLSYDTNSDLIETMYYLFQGGKATYAVLKFKMLEKTNLDYLLKFYEERYEYLGLTKNNHYFTDEKKKRLIAVSIKPPFTALYSAYKEKED